MSTQTEHSAKVTGQLLDYLLVFKTRMYLNNIYQMFMDLDHLNSACLCDLAMNLEENTSQSKRALGTSSSSQTPAGPTSGPRKPQLGSAPQLQGLDKERGQMSPSAYSFLQTTNEKKVFSYIGDQFLISK